MPGMSQADQMLLDAIAQGDVSGWEQLVERYQGRLLAFARQKLRSGHSGDAEDLVQDTFLRFLQGIQRFRGDASLETYLFSILRRRIIDVYRGREGRLCLLSDVLGTGDGSGAGSGSGMRDGRGSDPLQSLDQAVFSSAASPTASWHVRQEESQDLATKALADALEQLVQKHQHEGGLRELQILEMVFYAQLSNKQAAEHADVRENFVGVLKHRAIKQLVAHLPESLRGQSEHSEEALSEGVLTKAWEAVRPSCPKRSTLGQCLLKALGEPWQSHVHFHVHTLGCPFCLANWQDLEEKTLAKDDQRLKQQVMASTIGLLKPVRS